MKFADWNGAGVAALGLLATSSVVAAGGGSHAPLEGRWAGDRLHLVIDASGGRVESDCAEGRFAGPVMATAEGRFSAQGSYNVHLPGPQRADTVVPADATEARFTGELHDNLLTLSILPAGASRPLVFELRSGERLKLIRCL